MARSFLHSLTLLLAGAGVLFLSGCGGEEKVATSANSQFQPADVTDESSVDSPATSSTASTADRSGSSAEGTSSSAAGQPAKPKPIAVEELDSESLPDGPPEAILTFMRQMFSYSPRGITQDAKRSDMLRVLRLMMEAGDRAMAHPDATPEQRREAAESKLSAVLNLARLGEPNADAELTAYSTRLTKDADPSIAQIGRSVLFSNKVAKMQEGAGDPAPVLEELKSLLKDEDPEHIILGLGTRAAHALNQSGHVDAAAEALTLLGNKYKNDPDEQIAKQAETLLKQASLVKLDLRGKLYALLSDKPDANAPVAVVETVQKLLADPEAGEMQLSMANQAADILERTDHYKAAEQVLQLITQRFSTGQDKELAAKAKDTVDSAGKRLALLGKPLEFVGKTLDGRPFDSTSLRGKVVLIDFWATWCGPCLDELPNIKKAYEEYKDKGFEVVGYNLDDNEEDLQRFFAVQQLPWATIVSADPKRTGFESPLATACGVQSIPFLVLLDTEGKVIALHVQGEKLSAKLAELLGPANSAGAE
jgi:thiol-disulfide isomerase/thioredoxin